MAISFTGDGSQPVENYGMTNFSQQNCGGNSEETRGNPQVTAYPSHFRSERKPV